jgi:type IV pilus assembly protein PilY1
VVVDVNGDRVADIVYAGDLLGNLWKFDVSDKSPNKWGVIGNTPLFKAVGPNGERQPITAKPTIAGHPDGGVMVFFGTGQYFAEGDEVVPVNIQDRDVYSFYAIQDMNSGTPADDVVARDELVQQTILTEDSFDPENPLGDRFRTTTEEAVPLEMKGWYVDLISPNEGRQEERVVVEPIVFGSDILFVTVVPNEEACAFGGDSWIMVLDAFSGAMPDLETMDTNDDDVIDSEDRRVAGVRSLGGVTSKPTLVETAGGPTLAIATGSRINPVTGRPTHEQLIRAGAIGGRQAWRQIQ